MRRWLVLLAGVAAIALTGTALALTGSQVIGDEETATETTVKTETTTTTIEEPAEPEPTPTEQIDHDEEVVEKPESSSPVEIDDHTPPAIEILYPEDGQVFESHEVVFEGSSEPGARVFFGAKEADGAEDGSWRIVLYLDEGENHVTATALDRSGNEAIDTVTVIVEHPEEPKKEEPKEQPKEEPNEQPKEEPKEQPKEEPKEEEIEWEFTAHQVYGECSEIPPYDVFYGTGKPGTIIVIEAEFGRKATEVGENGEWEVKVVFEGAPLGEAFPVWVVDKFGHEKVFEFTRTD